MKKSWLILSCLIALLIHSLYIPVESQAQVKAVPAFPGAEGFGAMTPGGRGGRVYFVETTADDIPAPRGSLREAVEAEGPRIVIFRVGGTIELQSTLAITHPYITIAGQTAPGDGIALKNGMDQPGPAVEISTHDVVIRHLRIRPGPANPNEESETEAIRMTDNARDVVVDHCSLSWGVDENLSTWGSNTIRNITIQWSIISEALFDSNHHKGAHSMGSMAGRGSGDISMHHNLFAHNNRRNPRIKTTDGVVDFAYNVLYNYGAAAGECTDDEGPIDLNFRSNFIKDGPRSNACSLHLWHEEDKPEFGFVLFLQDNWRLRRDGGEEEAGICAPQTGVVMISQPHPAPPIAMSSAREAFQQVLAYAGAILPKRDPVDQRILEETRTGGGRIIDDPSQVGGWPVLNSATPPADADRDGMPDDWENFYGFNRLNLADGSQDADGDGYTNVEEYLNGTFPIPPTLPRVGEVVVPSDHATYHYEENIFVSSYSISTATPDVKDMRLLISNTLREEDYQFYGVVLQETPGVFKAYLHNGYSRYPETKDIPGKGWVGGYPIGVGRPLHDGRYIENRWARWNVGESFVAVDTASRKIQAHWSILFLYGYKVQLSQTVFSSGSSRYGETDPSPQHGWHSRGSWAVLGEGTVVKNSSFEFNAPGSTSPPSFWSLSPGTPWNTRFELMAQPVTQGTRSLRIETIPSNVNYYQGVWQDTKSPGPGKSLVFACDLFVARGTAVINVYTFNPFPNVVWLGNAVVNANGGFQKINVPFRTLAVENYQRLHYRIDGIQPSGTTTNTLFFVDNATLEVK